MMRQLYGLFIYPIVSIKFPLRYGVAKILTGGLLLLITYASLAETQVMTLALKNHLFNPSELIVPANTKIKLVINNRDPSAEEFESDELNRKKLITGNSQVILFIGPLSPGEYSFSGEFHIKTAQGKVIVH